MAVNVKSYLPLEKKERSKLQQVKDKHMSFTKASKDGIPKDIDELKLIRNREHAIAYLNQYIDIGHQSISKSKYCEDKHISHNSLNMGLEQLGYRTRVLRIKRDQLRRVETEISQLKLTETNPSEIVQNETKLNVRKTKKSNKGIIEGCGHSKDEEDLTSFLNSNEIDEIGFGM